MECHTLPIVKWEWAQLVQTCRVTASRLDQASQVNTRLDTSQIFRCCVFPSCSSDLTTCLLPLWEGQTSWTSRVCTLSCSIDWCILLANSAIMLCPNLTCGNKSRDTEMHFRSHDPISSVLIIVPSFMLYDNADLKCFNEKWRLLGCYAVWLL
jgi:hypothetical protein